MLNAGQSTAAAAPFLLVLAGTPGLTLHLDRMSATFWNRARHIGVGLLDEDAAADALVRRWQPGIPSLMPYLRSPAAAGAATDART